MNTVKKGWWLLSPVSGGGGGGGDAILMEDSGYIQMEDGSNILIE